MRLMADVRWCRPELTGTFLVGASVWRLRRHIEVSEFV
jgi:hypothetical protein